MTTTDLTGGRRSVARKQPANAPANSQPEPNPQTINGQWTAVRGGPTGAGMAQFIVLLFLAAGLLGLILSLATG